MDPIAVLALLVAPLALGWAALHWGVDSTDGVDSPEWERRRDWGGLGAPDWRS